MADIKKFLDKGGVSTLWSQIAAEVKKVDDKVVEHAGKITTLESKVAALEAGTYDDTEVRGLIATNATDIEMYDNEGINIIGENVTVVEGGDIGWLRFNN